MTRAAARSARDLFSACYLDLRGPDAMCAVAERISEVGLVTFDGLDSRDATLEIASTDGRAVHSDLQANQPNALAALTEPRAAFFGRADGVFAPVFDHAPGGQLSIRLRQDGLVRWHPFTRTYVPPLRTSATRHQQPLELGAGEGYLLDNHRWLHARTAFLGPRRCYRALGNPRFPLPRGFAPHDATAIPLETR
ncbi:putative taurine dioxygenase [Streptomyces sp. NBRC 110611]|uniref:hypothetical protein n=1 Tax=Streptomyces sp. NBRC 110611 TaxID=1621259 RepID=UPI000834EADF|nr:hypothetical protein [Streptomyces sp. NBRC 110611]GAU71130.1 putative taurine dioxygenase [Streptomyces sp. NBRC 110611]